MSDRELLELAAKAVGIEFYNDFSQWKHQDWCRFWDDSDLCTCGSVWDPLKNDRDAARLECELSLNIEWSNTGVKAGGGVDKFGFHARGEFEPFDSHQNKNAARRMASVRAAAEIARGMP